MTWPAAQVKTSFDQSSDDPKIARSEIAGNVDKFNQLQAHVSSYIQGLLDDADAAAARTTLGAQPLDATLTSLAAVAGVAGDILYASGTDTWARLAKGSDGEGLVLTSGIPAWGAAGATIVEKTADETVNNSTTLQDDNHLVFALAANTTYVVDIVLILNAASTTPDFKFGWTFPTSCTILWEDVFNGWIDVSNPTVINTESDTGFQASIAGTIGAIVKAIVRNGANTGNLQFQWAQNTANGSDSKLLKHSHMIIRSLGAT